MYRAAGLKKFEPTCTWWLVAAALRPKTAIINV
jgi:hypothetical protein